MFVRYAENLNQIRRTHDRRSTFAANSPAAARNGKMVRIFKGLSKGYKGCKIALAPSPLKDYQDSRRAGIAQLVEHLICNQGVAGSNPAAGTTFSTLCLPTVIAKLAAAVR